MKRLRVYVDTSVISGCLDEEFAEESRALLQMAREGTITLLVSDILAAELARAPEPVQAVLAELPPESLELVPSTEEGEALRDGYVEAGVVGPSARDDAHHVAIATVAGADVIVSWNFRHIVHFAKIRGFNAVNLQQGYKPIDVHSPKEVVW